MLNGMWVWINWNIKQFDCCGQYSSTVVVNILKYVQDVKNPGVDIQGLVCDNPFQGSEVLQWHSSTLQKDHIPPWRCSNVITNHWSFLLSFDEAVNTKNTNDFRLKIKRTIIYLSAKLLIYKTFEDVRHNA